MRCPGLARFGIVVGRFAGHWRDSNQVVAVWTFNLPPGEGLVALEVLIALRAGKLELVHKSWALRVEYKQRRGAVNAYDVRIAIPGAT